MYIYNDNIYTKHEDKAKNLNKKHLKIQKTHPS